MINFKESLKLRQKDVKPAAKHMASQHIEKGNFKKTLDLLKFMGKKVNVDKSTEGTSKAVWTIEGTMNEMKLPISDEMFKSLKKGDKIKIGFDSSIKKGNENTYVVVSKTKSAKYNLEKIKLKNVANPVAQASFLYNRQGKVTMAQGDMAVTMNTAVKESVEEASILKTVHKNVTNKKSAEKDRKKAVKTLKDIRKGKYPGVKMANEDVVLEEAMLNEFSDAQLAQLKKAYADLERINVTSPTYKKLKAMIAKMDVKALEKVARAKVRFVSQIAAREYEAKSGNRLKAKDYMESTKLDKHRVTMQKLRNAPKGAPVMKKAGKDAKMLRFVLNRDVKLRKESIELDEAIDFRKAHQEIMAYAKKSGGIDKTDFEKVAYYVKAIGDNQNTPNVANKAFMAMKKFVGDMDTDPRDGVMLMLKKHGMMKNGRLVQESITEGALGKQWVNGAKRVKSGSITLVKAKFAYDLHTVMKNGKKVGTFVFDDGPDAFSVTNMSTKKVSWADQIDDIPKMFESKAPALKSSDYAKGTYQSAQAFKDKFAKKKKESVDEAALEEKTKWKMGDGRPRNGPRIENERFWNLPYDSLKYIAKDAGDAMRANPTARKATTGPGNWADQVADAATVMQWRKKNGIKESVEEVKPKTFFDLR